MNQLPFGGFIMEATGQSGRSYYSVDDLPTV